MKQHLLRPDFLQLKAGHENVNAGANISRMNREDRYPKVQEDIQRLMWLKPIICIHEGCKKRGIHHTPKGNYCSDHREEAIDVMRQCGRIKYGFN